ncbi:MAG: endolytic transglycosylase MltG [Alphaproteobacteria bacterium]|nr:endolytic transglycosylase MltG [Alphaproteobacteria bacterium]
MRWFIWAASFLCAVLLVGGTAAAIWCVNTYRAPGPITQEASFIVARGQGLATVAENLEREGMIDSALLFRAAARVTQADKGVHAGEYAIPPYASMAMILDKMVKGEVVQRKITVREGLTSWQVVKLVKQAPGLEGEITEMPREGTLLPETYHYLLGDKRADIILKMQNDMTKTIAELWPLRQENLPIKTEKEAVILAAIVEKETGVAEERARVAGVFINRLRIGMPLQSDPTVIYAMTGGLVQDEGQGPIGRRLLSADMQFDSPFNTYKYPGLPPAPIANPGRASIEAVLNPEAHEYLYFVADTTGGHAFGKTLAEHNANVAKWRAFRKQSGN